MFRHIITFLISLFICTVAQAQPSAVYSDCADIDGCVPNAITASSSDVLSNKSFSDNVGIGTPTPLQKVDIFGTSPRVMFKDSDNTGNNRRWLIGAADNGFANATNFFIQSSLDNGATMSPDFFMWPTYAIGIGTFDLDGRLTIMGRGTGNSRSLQIKNSAGSTYFDVYDNGNVGIGTTTEPRSRLDIGAGQLTAGSINLPSGEGYFTSTAGMYFDPDGSGPLLRLTQGRNIGIGTSAPSTTVELVKQGTNAPLMISSTATGDGDYIKILSNGNVGINTIEPTQKLETVGTIKATAFVGDGSGLTGLPAGGGWVDGGTNIYASPTTDSVGIGTTTPMATLNVVKSGTNTPFMVSSVAGGIGDYLVVTSEGSVGIGTASPLATNNQWYGMLYKNANALREMVVRNPNTGTSAAAGFELVTNNSNGYWRQYPTNYTNATLAGLSFIHHETGNGLGISTDYGGISFFTNFLQRRMTIDNSSGNVGIATVSPTSKLQVVGTVAATTFSGSGSSLTSLDDDAVGFDDANNDFTASTIGAAVEELVSVNGFGINSSTAKVDWTQLGNVPAGFADGTDDGAGGGSPGGSDTELQYRGGASTFSAVSGSGVDANGNVGIGTVDPTQKLQVVGTVNATAFVGDGSGLTGISAGGWTDGGTNVYNSTTTDTVGIGTTNASGTLEIVKQGSSVPLMVSATATGDGNYLIVNSAGNVGMGTVLPSAILDVVSANYPVAEFTRTSSATNTVSGAIKYKALSSATVADGFGVNFGAFIEGSGLAETQIGELAFIRDGANNSGAITFRPYASGSANERARISSNGNFGIGTTSPQTPLQVSGDSKIGNGTFSNTSANEDLYVEGNLEVDGTLYIDSCSGAGCGAGGASGWTDGGTNVYTATTTDTVGIGTTTPSTTLEIVKQGSSAPLMVSSTATGDGDVLIITSGGNVGIGTLLPRGPLDLGPTGTLYAQTITGPTGPTILGTAGNVGIGTYTAGALLTVGSTGQTTIASTGAVSTSSTVTVATEAYDDAGWNGDNTVPTKDAVRDKIETIAAPGWTDGGTTLYNTTSTDNVGIGTTSANKALVIYGSDPDMNFIGVGTTGFMEISVHNNQGELLTFGGSGSNAAGGERAFISVEQNSPLKISTNALERISVTAGGSLKYVPTDTPETCDSTCEGCTYYDDSLAEMCDCNGSSWAQVDGGGAC